MEPFDYIDQDEGRNSPAPFFTEGEPCENCGQACVSGSRIYVPGFDFMGCQDCAEESRVVIFAEQNCPTLHDAVIRAKTTQQVAQAMRQHENTCPNCNPKLRKPAEVVEMPSPQVERKEAA